MAKPMIVAMNNPQGSHPLWPDPPMCAGWRLWKMLEFYTGASKEEYLRTFERRNLSSSRKWDPAEARRNAPIIRSQFSDRKVVICGVDTLRALELFNVPKFYSWRKMDDFQYVLIPHPSGLNRIYNDPAYVLMTSLVLAELYNENVARYNKQYLQQEKSS